MISKDGLIAKARLYVAMSAKAKSIWVVQTYLRD